MPLRRVLTIFFLSLLAASITACGSSNDNFGPGQSYQNFDAPVRLAFLNVPQRAAGTAFGTIRVGILDFNGQIVPTATHAVTLSLEDPNGATLSGDTTVNAVNGVAVFTGISVDRPGNYNFVATADGLIPAESQNFTITAGAPAQVTFLSQPPAPPTTVARGETLPPIQVEVRDALGNLVSTASTVTMVIGNDPSGQAELGGTTQVAAVNGVATFDDLSITSGGGAMVLAAVAGEGLAVSEPFVVLAPFAIYATTFPNPPLPSLLVTVDPTTFTPTPVGPLNAVVTGLTAHPDGRLLGAIVNGAGQATLVEVDPVPGAPTITPIGTSLTGEVGSVVTDLAVDHRDGTVYAYMTGTTPVGLYTVDTTTGEAAPVGAGSGYTGGGNGLEWDPFEMALFATPDDNSSLVTLDTSTGAGTDVPGTAGNLLGDVVHLTINPFDTTLFGIRRDAAGTPGTEQLITIDKETGEATVLPADVQGVVSATFRIQ